MVFHQVAEILYKLHSGTKWTFTAELFNAGLPTPYFILSEATDSDKSRLRKYFTGERGISEIAAEIYGAFDNALFIDYLNELYECNFDQIRDDFLNHGERIEEGDEPARLSELFHALLFEALHKATTEQTQRKKRADTFPRDKTDGQIFASDRNAIADILIRLEKLLRQMNDPTHEALLVYDYLTEEEKHSYHTDITRKAFEIESLSADIGVYGNRYPQIKELSEIGTMGGCFIKQFYSVHSSAAKERYRRYQLTFYDTVTTLNSQIVSI